MRRDGGASMSAVRNPPRRRPRRALAALVAALACAPPAAAGPVERLDVPIRTPVYRLPDGAELPGERFHYALRWAGLVVGRATVDLRDAGPGGGLAVEVRGATHPAIDWLYRLRVRAHGRVRTAPFAPDHFVVEQCEGDRRERTEVRFPASGAEVRGTRERRGRVDRYAFDSENTWDIPSATLLLLGLDYAPGARFELDTFTGRHRHLLSAEVEGAERIVLAGAPHDAWRLRLETRSLTRDRERDKHRGSTVWVSAQRPRRVLRARSETLVGALTLELENPAADVGAVAERGTSAAARCAGDTASAAHAAGQRRRR